MFFECLAFSEAKVQVIDITSLVRQRCKLLFLFCRQHKYYNTKSILLHFLLVLKSQSITFSSKRKLCKGKFQRYKTFHRC